MPAAFLLASEVIFHGHYLINRNQIGHLPPSPVVAGVQVEKDLNKQYQLASAELESIYPTYIPQTVS